MTQVLTLGAVIPTSSQRGQENRKKCQSAHHFICENLFHASFALALEDKSADEKICVSLCKSVDTVFTL